LKLPSGLISNLENEFVLEIKVKDIEEKRKEIKKNINEKENTSKI
jgi:hypothetical protein